MIIFSGFICIAVTLLSVFFCSCVHDHADSHCFMKVLGGGLKETQFHWPDKEENDKKKPLREKGFKSYPTNGVTYINGNIIILHD